MLRDNEEIVIFKKWTTEYLGIFFKYTLEFLISFIYAFVLWTCNYYFLELINIQILIIIVCVNDFG